MSNRDGAPDNAKGPAQASGDGSDRATSSQSDVESLLDGQGPVGLPEGEELQIWLSAFADGELPDPHAELLMAALEEDPALLAQLELIAASSSATLFVSPLLGQGHAVSLTDGILAAVAPTELDAEAADRLASLAADDALEGAALEHLHGLAGAPGNAQAVADFLDTTDAIRAQGEAGGEHPSLNALLAPMPDLVGDVVKDDTRAAELSQLAVDGCIDDNEVAELAQLFTESPAHRDYREAGLAAFEAMSEATQVALEHVAGAPEAARAGAAALQAIGAQQAQAEAARESSRVPAVREHEAGLMGWLADRFRYLAPVAFAGAAAAVFFAVSDPRQLDPQAQPIDAPVDDILHTLEDDIEEDIARQKVALNQDLALLGDNHSDVLSIDTGSRATLVYETEASNITVIWVSDPADGDDDDFGDEAQGDEAQGDEGQGDEALDDDGFDEAADDADDEPWEPTADDDEGFEALEPEQDEQEENITL